MQYRIMPDSKEKLSILGFGCMRFETDEQGKIVEPKALEMLQYAFEHGINYFDTAWPYHGEQSEPLLGQFLKTIDRSKVYVATKLPSWLIKTPEDMDSYLEQQLERLGVEYIDYYLVHALNTAFWKNLKQQKLFDFLNRAQAKGLIRKVGFSFHDSYPLFKRIVDAYPWDFCQIMLNYLDTHYQAGLKGMKYAADKGLGIVVMEPLRGGKLVDNNPPSVQKIWAASPIKQSMAERALNWVWNYPEVQVLLSGMSNMQQLAENIKIAGKARANAIPEQELKRYQRVRREHLKQIQISCSECRYCLPCPSGLPIPSIFGMYNEAFIFHDKVRAKKEYEIFIPEKARADKCVQCGVCKPKCPRAIDIPGQMKRIAEYFQS